MSAIDEQLRLRAGSVPAEPAMVACSPTQSTVWTWAELDAVTARIAAEIAAAAVRPRRSVVLVGAGNDASALAQVVGALRTDLPLALLAGGAPAGERQALRETLLRAGYDVVVLAGARAVAHRSAVSTARPLPAEAVLLATGGSAGHPKLVVDHRLRTVARRPRATRPSSIMNWRRGQHQMVIGPLHHAAPLTYFIEGLCDGNLLIVPAVFDAATVLAAIGEWRVEWFQLSPYHLRALAVAVRRGGNDLSGVQGMLHHAAPCPDALEREWLALVEPSRVFEMYGATEGIGVTVASGEQWLRRPGTVGRGFFTQLRILDDGGRALPCGELGDVYLRSGPPPTRHYLEGDDRLRTTVDGFATVGDRGWVDQDGYLYLARRQFARIQVGGETVDPAEVESALCAHPGVLDAAVLGVPDPRLGESLVAFVIAVDGVEGDAAQLRRYLRERIARHKVPGRVRFLPQLPQTDAGKLDRRRLAILAGQNQEVS